MDGGQTFTVGVGIIRILKEWASGSVLEVKFSTRSAKGLQTERF